MTSTITDRVYGESSTVAVKAPCVSVSNGISLPLVGLTAVGGYTPLVGDRILVKDQTDPSTNGIYNASVGAWRRSGDFDGPYDCTQGTLIVVYFPNAGATIYQLVTLNPIIGTTPLAFSSFVNPNQTYPQTAAEAAVPVVPTNFSYAPWRGEDVRRIGVTGGGIIDDRAALFAANSIGSSLYFPPGTYKISSNLIFTVPLIFDYGAILKPDAGVTITINAPVDAGPWKIFDESASGIIAGLIRPVNAAGRMYFEWWGAVGDNATDDVIPCQATLRAAMTANYVGIQMLPKQYRLTAQLNANGNTTQSFKAPSIYGCGGHISQFTATTGIYLLSYRGGSGTNCDTVVEGVGFVGISASGIAVKINAQCGLRFRRCLFDSNQYGVHFYNLDAGSFSEFNVLEDCEFTYTCLTALLYQVGAGTNSFHGSGIVRGIMTSNTTNPMVIISAGCRPYECPLDGQVFYANANTLIQNNSSLAVDFFGKLTTENLGGAVLTLATGGNVPYVGTISASQQNVVGGTLTQMQGVVTNSNTIQTYLGARKAYTGAMTTGANTLTSSVFNQHRFTFVRFLAAGYDYRYLLGVDPSGGATAGVVGTIFNYLATNTAGYGAPTFSVTTGGQLIATNAGWPASGVTAYWGDSTLGFGNETLEVVQI